MVNAPLDVNEAQHRDEDETITRTGTMWTACAHIITAVIGSGVLSLAWGVAQLGWLAGVSALIIFAIITMYTSGLLADSYRSPGTGERNHTYIDAVTTNLGTKWGTACLLVQYTNLTGVLIGYTITAAMSCGAIERIICYHNKGLDAHCPSPKLEKYMIVFGIIELFLSQIPNFHKLSILSVIAAMMSLGYSTIGLGLGLATVVAGNTKKTTMTGIVVASASDKTWRVFRALGDIAFAYTFSQVLIEIQDTLKSSPPENKVMRRASVMGVATTTAFYMMCGCFGYAAFGNNAPGNLLTGFFEPYWLVSIANAFIIIHLIGAWQVFCQPIFRGLESRVAKHHPESKWVTSEYRVSKRISFNLLRLVWRSLFVITATLVASQLQSFNSVIALTGALGFWPLTVCFPIEMYIARKKIRRSSPKGLGIQALNLFCFVVSVSAASGAIEGLIALKKGGGGH